MPKENEREAVMRRWSEVVRDALPTAVRTAGLERVSLEQSDTDAVFLANVLGSLFVNGDSAADGFAAEVVRRFRAGLTRPKPHQRIADADEIVTDCCGLYEDAIKRGEAIGAAHNNAASSRAEQMVALLSIFVDRRFEKIDMLAAKRVLSRRKRRRDGRLGAQAILVELNKLAGGPLGRPAVFGVETIKDAKKRDRRKDA